MILRGNAAVIAMATVLMGQVTAGSIALAGPADGSLAGSPESTVTLDGKQLPPPPDKHFGGNIERNVIDSTPYWPPRVVAPESAPNILLIITMLILLNKMNI